MSWQFILAGLLVGTLVGMTGMGGGSLMTPILVLLLGFSPYVATGQALLVLVAYMTAFLTLSGLLLRRRDVT